MAGKPGQKSTKATEPPYRYKADFLRGMDRRCRQARRLRDRFLRLVERCGGIEQLDEEDLDRLQRYVHLNHRLGRTEEACVRGERVDDSVINDTMRSWLALDRRVELIKIRHQGGGDLAKAFEHALKAEEGAG